LPTCPKEISSMPITFRLRDVSRVDEMRLRDVFETMLDGDWSVTVSQSHLDGQWHLQIEGAGECHRTVVPSFDEVVLAELAEALLSPSADRPKRWIGVPRDLSIRNAGSASA
jgi:hypothetical protein